MALAKRAAVLLLVVTWLAGLPATGLAQAYTVRGIEVDVEAEDAVTARELAIEEAQQKGLRRLLERLTLERHFDQLPAVGEQALTRLVSAFEVEEESTSATRYVGRLSVVYDEAAVQALMQGTGVPLVVDLPPPVLVVPALQTETGAPSAFSGPDGWRDAWEAEAERDTLLAIDLPLGDLADLRTLAETALASEPEAALAAAAERHDSDAAILLVARADDPEAPTRVTVSLAAAHAWPTDFSGESLAMEGDAETVWRAAVRQVMRTLENEWKAANLVSMSDLARLPVEVSIESLEGWAAIRRGLAEVAAIRRVDIESFSQSEAALVVNHIGNVDQLRRALATRGLELSEGAERWRLQRVAGRDAG